MQNATKAMSTFGPSFDEARDGERLYEQMARVLKYMLDAARKGHWLTVEQIAAGLEWQYGCKFPDTSVSAQLRHLRKDRFGAWDVRRRWREDLHISEYRIYGNNIPD